MMGEPLDLDAIERRVLRWRATESGVGFPENRYAYYANWSEEYWDARKELDEYCEEDLLALVALARAQAAEIVRLQDIIGKRLAHIDDAPLTPAEIAHGQALARRMGLLAPPDQDES